MKIAMGTELDACTSLEPTPSMMRPGKIHVAAVLILACAAILGGCAAPAASTAMVPETAVNEKTHPYSVNVEVTGGRATEPTGTPQISNENFDEAITKTLVKTKTFAKVQKKRSGNYELSVIIFDVQQPSSGTTASVTLETGWTLTNQLSGDIVWQKALRSTYTASSNSDVTFVGRLKKATEGAAKDTIKQGVTEISRLDL
jgi:ABC-type uncharacterized transport system auxiliary subunit